MKALYVLVCWLLLRVGELMTRRVILSLAALLVAPVVSAQTVVTNPNYIDFDSPDHYLQGVTVYHIDFTQQGASAPFTGFDLNAGALMVLDPNVVKLEVNLLTQGTTQLVSLPFGTNYTASVIVVNATGQSARSTPSNPFVRAALTPRAALNVIVGKK